MIARTLIALGVLLSAIAPAAQTADPYVRLVRMYRTDPSPATMSMARLNSDAINSGTRGCVRECGRADLLAGPCSISMPPSKSSLPTRSRR